MTEHRLFESAIGLAARLSFTPCGTERAEECGWRSSRDSRHHAPLFRELGPLKVWIPSGSDHLGDPPLSLENPSEKSRRQQRCLLKSHPEASLGNEELHEHLLEGNSLFSSHQQHSWRSSLFSFGELTSTSDPQRIRGIPMVVTVTGAASNILQLARLEQEEWRWPGKSQAGVLLAEISNEHPATWVEETPGPIHHVKCIVDPTRYNPTRWLAVQRGSGTAVFRPEYRRAPTALRVGLERDPSRIAVNPLFHIPIEQTGGNVHTDVAFNPSTRSNPPQIGVVDERGCWSVWDITHTKAKSSSKALPKLKICGHIEQGIMERNFYQFSSEPDWHGVLWVGRLEDHLSMIGALGLDDAREKPGLHGGFRCLERSNLLLVYNSQKVKVLDLNTGFHLPDLEFVRQNSLDCVLDVQISPHSPQYFYVLTTSRIFLARTHAKAGAPWDKPEYTWSILFSTPHFRSSFDRSIRLSTTQSVISGETINLLFLYSADYPWFDLFCVTFSNRDPTQVRCQRNVAAFNDLQNASLESTVRELCIHRITPVGNVSYGPHGDATLMLAGRLREFYQVIALRSDKTLLSTLCMSPASHGSRISAPTGRVSRAARADRERKRMLQHLASRFVVPDELNLEDETTPRPSKTNIGKNERAQNTRQRFVKPFHDFLNERFQSRLNSRVLESSSDSDTFGSNPFDIAHLIIQGSLESMTMSLRTLVELMPRYEEAAHHALPALRWDDEIARLNQIHPSIEVFFFDLLRSNLGLPKSASFQEAHKKLLEVINCQWDDKDMDDARGIRTSISRQLRYDIYLSTIGVGYPKPDTDRDSGAVPSAGAQQVEQAEYKSMGSQTDESLASSPPRQQSPTSSSQRSDTAAVEGEDPAMVLLRRYTGTGKFVPQKHFDLLDKWELGADPADYVFDLDRNAEADEGVARRAKQRAREERKRRRAESLLHLSQEPELPATQPAPDTSFFSSQPTGEDSQNHVLRSDPLHTMSQPMTGAFGRRPKKIAKKRKGGF